MTKDARSPLATGRMKKAVQNFCELVEAFPERTRQEILNEVQVKFDLSPLECEFLCKHLTEHT